MRLLGLATVLGIAGVIGTVFALGGATATSVFGEAARSVGPATNAPAAADPPSAFAIASAMAHAPSPTAPAASPRPVPAAVATPRPTSRPTPRPTPPPPPIATSRPTPRPTPVSRLISLSLPAHAGYTAVAGVSPFSAVSGTWIEPAVGCATSNSIVMIWVGLDDNGTYLEQAGSYIDCRTGAPVYRLFYEMYPALAVRIDLAVVPGDQIGAEVSYGSGAFTLVVRNFSSGLSWSTSQPGNMARARAQWMVEIPTSYDPVPFGSVVFSNVAAVDVGGHHGGLNIAAWRAYRIFMVRGASTLATTGAPTASGSSFRVTTGR